MYTACGSMAGYASAVSNWLTDIHDEDLLWLGILMHEVIAGLTVWWVDPCSSVTHANDVVGLHDAKLMSNSLCINITYYMNFWPMMNCGLSDNSLLSEWYCIVHNCFSWGLAEVHSAISCFVVCDIIAMPVLFKPPVVSTSSDHRHLVIQWPEWLANVTGNGSGPVVSHTLQGLAQNENADWYNLVTMRQQHLDTYSRLATAAIWFTYVAEGDLAF